MIVTESSNIFVDLLLKPLPTNITMLLISDISVQGEIKFAVTSILKRLSAQSALGFGSRAKTGSVRTNYFSSRSKSTFVESNRNFKRKFLKNESRSSVAPGAHKRRSLRRRDSAEK